MSAIPSSRFRGPAALLRLGSRLRETEGTTGANPTQLGTVGSVLIALSALRIGALPRSDVFGNFPILGWFSTSAAGLIIGILGAVLGAVMLVAAWISLGRDVLRRPTPLVADLPSLARTVGLWSIPFLLCPPILSSDAYAYAAQAHIARLGMNPYLVTPLQAPSEFSDAVDPTWKDFPAPYGPLFLFAAGRVLDATDQIPGDRVLLGVIGLRLLAAAGVLLLVAFLPRLAAAVGGDPMVAMWLGAANPMVILHFVGGMHNDALMMGLLVAGMALAAEGRLVHGVIVVTASALVKPIALIGVAFVVLLWVRARVGDPELDDSARWSLRARLGMVQGATKQRLTAFVPPVLLALSMFAVISLASGIGLGWIRGLSNPGSVFTALSLPTVVGSAAGWLVAVVGLPDMTDHVVATLREVGIVVASLGISVMLLRHRGRDVATTCGYAFALLLLLSPAVQPWYLLWPVILLGAGNWGVYRPGIAESRRRLLALVWGSAAFTFFTVIDGAVLLSSSVAIVIGVLTLGLLAVVSHHLAQYVRPRDADDGDLLAVLPTHRELMNALHLH